MKRLVLIGACLFLWAISSSLNAQGRGGPEAQIFIEQPSEQGGSSGFSHRLTGSYILADGDEQPIDFVLSFNTSENGGYFRAGNSQVRRDSPPSAYLINIILDGEGHAYVREFTDQRIQGMTLHVEGHQIELFRSDSQSQHIMRLRLNDRQFLFDSSHPRLRLDLNEHGLYNITAERTMRDLSIRRVQ